MPSIVGPSWARGPLVLLLCALTACGHERAMEVSAPPRAGATQGELPSAASAPDVVGTTDRSPFDPDPTPAEQPLSVRGLREDERAAYEREMRSELGIEVTKDCEPELWERV